MSTNKQETKMKKSNAVRKSEAAENVENHPIGDPNKIAPPVVETKKTSAVDENGRKREVMLNLEEWYDICQAKGLKSKSARIRYLYGEGYNYRAVANFLGIIYQHVYNVMHQQPKKASTLAPAAETEEDKG